jgi:hypothetical protein
MAFVSETAKSTVTGVRCIGMGPLSPSSLRCSTCWSISYGTETGS